MYGQPGAWLDGVLELEQSGSHHSASEMDSWRF